VKAEEFIKKEKEEVKGEEDDASEVITNKRQN